MAASAAHVQKSQHRVLNRVRFDDSQRLTAGLKLTGISSTTSDLDGFLKSFIMVKNGLSASAHR
jgi:hypothetical protein